MEAGSQEQETPKRRGFWRRSQCTPLALLLAVGRADRRRPRLGGCDPPKSHQDFFY